MKPRRHEIRVSCFIRSKEYLYRCNSYIEQNNNFKKRGFFVNNGDYKNKKTFNNRYNAQKQSNSNFMKTKNYKQYDEDDRPMFQSSKRVKTSQIQAVLDNITIPEYISAKTQVRDKRQRDLEYKRQKRR